MKEKFLLYIDILGFSDLVNNQSEKVREIYDVINNLNVHKHDDFQTIIFSDTILVYNKIDAETLKDKQYVLMYMIEFVQNLLYNGNELNLNFRAIITYGEFEHYKLKNIECYFGKSLIYAYLKEKDINGIGLFLDSRLEKYNNIFKSCKYNSDLNFVFLFQTILRLQFLTEGNLPLAINEIENTYNFCWLKDEIEILKKHFIESNQHENPKVRSKHLQTYQFYKNKMPDIFEQLEITYFSMKTINSEADWSKQSEGCIK